MIIKVFDAIHIKIINLFPLELCFIFIHNDFDGLLTGVVYIKFSKTSEAAKALEEMNGKTLGNPPGSRPLKVLVASR